MLKRTLWNRRDSLGAEITCGIEGKCDDGWHPPPMLQGARQRQSHVATERAHSHAVAPNALWHGRAVLQRSAWPPFSFDEPVARAHQRWSRGASKTPRVCPVAWSSGTRFVTIPCRIPDCTPLYCGAYFVVPIAYIRPEKTMMRNSILFTPCKSLMLRNNYVRSEADTCMFPKMIM